MKAYLLKSFILAAITAGPMASARGINSEYKVHTHCTYRDSTGAAYAVHIRTRSDLGEWKVRMDLLRTDRAGQNQLLSSKIADYIQHTGGETFRASNMKLEVYYVDPSTQFPGGERGIFTASFPYHKGLLFDGMSCAHAGTN